MGGTMSPPCWALAVPRSTWSSSSSAPNCSSWPAARRCERVLCCRGTSDRSGETTSAPQEAVLKAISEVSKVDGRVSRTTNLVMGGTVQQSSKDDWQALDQKVNNYPMERGFTAIGIGGDDFVQAMVVAVESVLQCPVPKDGITCKLSSKGKYVSVNIGPVQVESSEQVQAIYEAMRSDSRMKYFL